MRTTQVPVFRAILFSLLAQAARKALVAAFGDHLRVPRPPITGSPLPIVANFGKSYTEFALAEFEALRSELLSLITESRTLELSALGAAGAIWTWLLTRPTSVAGDEFVLVAGIPFLLTVLAIVRAVAIYLKIRGIGVYQREVERKFYASVPHLGWERSLPRRKALIAISSAVFWVALLGSTIFAIGKAKDLAKTPQISSVVSERAGQEAVFVIEGGGFLPIDSATRC